jgi:hypothetical protein
MSDASALRPLAQGGTYDSVRDGSAVVNIILRSAHSGTPIGAYRNDRHTGHDRE